MEGSLTAESRSGAIGRSVWLVLAYASALCFIAAAHLFWLLWKYVPVHAAVFADMGISLPRSTSIVFAVANWTIRLLPLVILVGVPLIVAVLVIASVVAAKTGTWHRMASGAVTLMLAAALVEILACGFVVHSVHAGYTVAATDARVQQDLRSFEEFRRHKASPQP